MKQVSDLTAEWARDRGLELDHTTETRSTNDDAKRQAHSEGRDFVFHLTGHQTHGRGRASNSWLDTGSGDALLCTLSFRLPQAPQPIAAPRVGIALFRAVAQVWPSANWGLKAPNDLYLGGRKVAGLLLESVTAGLDHRFLVGLGMNVYNHPRTMTSATHLSEGLGHAPDEAEWFRFMDEWWAQMLEATRELTQTQLESKTCVELKNALNANPQRSYDVLRVSPVGDLETTEGLKRWTEI